MRPVAMGSATDSEQESAPSGLLNIAAWILTATLFLIMTATTNLTTFGIGTNSLTYDDVALPRFVFALIGTAATWLILSLVGSRRGSFSVDSTWILLMALGVWSVISAFASDSVIVWLGQSERLEGVVTVLLYGALFGAGLQLGRSGSFLRRMSYSLAIAGTMLSVYGLFQVAKLDKGNYLVSGSSFYMGSAFASLTNPNFLGGLLVLTVPVTVAFALTARHISAKVAWWIASALSIGALYATYSQGAWGALVVEVSLAVGLWVWSGYLGRPRAGRRQKHARFKTIVPALAVVAIGVAIIIIATSAATGRGLRLWGEDLPESAAGRLLLLQTTVGAVGQHPLTGFGPDNFLTAFRLHRSEAYIDTYGVMSTNNNVHSWLPQYAATLGIPGALLLGLALAFGFWRSRPRSLVSMSESDQLMRAAIWIGAAGFAAQMMFNVSMLASTLPFWALLGAISAPYARRVSLPRPAGIAAIVVCAAVLGIVTIGSFRLVQADMAYLNSRLAYRGVTTGDAVALAEKAERLNPLSLKYIRAVAQSKSARLYRELAKPGVPESRVRELYAETKLAYDQTLDAAPNDYAAWAWLAGLQTFTGTYLNDSALLDAARKSAQTAAELDGPNTEVVPLLRGETSKSAIESALSAPALP